MRRWPPILWPLVYIASLLILAGGTGRWDPGLLIPGVAMVLVACAVSLYLALGPWGDRPRPPIVYWGVGGLLGIYVLIAAAAATAGPEYAVAGLLAGVIPLTALCLLIALARSKTRETESGLIDESAMRDDDPFPGIGMGDSDAVDDPAAAERFRRAKAARRSSAAAGP
jgi:hypothetical protein